MAYHDNEEEARSVGPFQDSMLGWSIILTIPIYIIMWYWPAFPAQMVDGLLPGLMGSVTVVVVQVVLIVFVFVLLFVRLMVRRWSLGLGALRAIVEDEDREDILGGVSDDINATYGIHAAWVHWALASWFGAWSWFIAGQVMTAGVVAAVALFFTIVAPRGARYAVRSTWQHIVIRSVEHERSKNPYSNETKPLPRNGRRQIVRQQGE